MSDFVDPWDQMVADLTVSDASFDMYGTTWLRQDGTWAHVHMQDPLRSRDRNPVMRCGRIPATNEMFVGGVSSTGWCRPCVKSTHAEHMPSVRR